MAERTPWVRFLGEVFYRHWGAKISALILAAILFVVTRDEVTRVFEVPLRVHSDADRVLMTALPETIRVKVRGPWIRINRLRDADFGDAELDLTDVKEGKLEITPAAVRMPPGVVLSDFDYEGVDLRFDPIVEAARAIRAPISGVPADDYEVLRVEVQPLQWIVRGGESEVVQVDSLVTASLEIDGATDDVTMLLAVTPPRAGVRLVAAGPNTKVSVRAIIDPKHEAREYLVPVVVPDELDPTGVIPRTYKVKVGGPLPDFRVLEHKSIVLPVEAQARLVERLADGRGTVEIDFSWSAAVPEDVRRRLAYDHSAGRVTVAPPPPPPPPVEELPVEEPA